AAVEKRHREIAADGIAGAAKDLPGECDRIHFGTQAAVCGERELRRAGGAKAREPEPKPVGRIDTEVYRLCTEQLLSTVVDGIFEADASFDGVGGVNADGIIFPARKVAVVINSLGIVA